MNASPLPCRQFVGAYDEQGILSRAFWVRKMEWFETVEEAGTRQPALRENAKATQTTALTESKTTNIINNSTATER